MTREELSSARSGNLISTQAFDDYGIKANHPYEIKSTSTYSYIWADGEIRTDNREIRDDMLPFLSITN